MRSFSAARMLRPAALIALMAHVAACTRAAPPEAPAPSPDTSAAEVPGLLPASGAPAIPPMPLATGPLAPRVQYPAEGALIASRDSNFIFGEVGNGRASLSINGHPVQVHPNGAFIAWIPVPSPELAAYELVATLGTDTARLVHRVRVLPPRVVLGDSGRLVVDTLSVAPRGRIALPADEPVRVSIRAPRNASVWVEAPGGLRRELVAGSVPPVLAIDPRSRADRIASSVGQSGGSVLRAVDDTMIATPDRYLRDPWLWATEVPTRWLASDSTAIVVARDADTLRFALTIADTLGPEGLGWAMVGPDTIAVADTDRVVYGRPIPGGTYRWFFLPGTVVRATGLMDGFVRVRLDSLLEVWVARDDVRFFGAGRAAPRRVVPNLRVIPSDDWVDVVMPIGERPPFQVQALGDRLELTLYDTRANSDIIQFVGNDSLIRQITWEQVADDRARYVLHLDRAPFGWLAMWDRGSFVLRVRRPPIVNADRPLAGLTIAVDAGHPPAGATGPTGLFDGVPVLDIARRVQRLLEARGANVLMTRTTLDTLALGERPIMARRANAHALISIHLNALPDGVNPFTAHGTGAYYFWPQSEPMAREIQRGMVRWMGLPNLGVYYDNLALVRPTWMPSVLAEGAFIMMPEQEYAVSTPEFQQRYAMGVAEGIEAFFRSLAERSR